MAQEKTLAQLMPSFSALSASTLQPITTAGSEISIYTGQSTHKAIIEQTGRLKKAFPALSVGFFDVLIERITEKNIPDTQLKDAISHLIDNCVYPTPTIANVLSYDKRIKLYNHADYCAAIDKGNSGTDFQVIKRNGIAFWVKLTDCEQYGINPENLSR